MSSVKNTQRKQNKKFAQNVQDTQDIKWVDFNPDYIKTLLHKLQKEYYDANENENANTDENLAFVKSYIKTELSKLNIYSIWENVENTTNKRVLLNSPMYRFPNGIIFEQFTWKLILLPDIYSVPSNEFYKFNQYFADENVLEVASLKNINNAYSPQLLKITDGTVTTLYYYNKRWAMATARSIDIYDNVLFGEQITFGKALTETFKSIKQSFKKLHPFCGTMQVELISIRDTSSTCKVNENMNTTPNILETHTIKKLITPLMDNSPLISFVKHDTELFISVYHNNVFLPKLSCQLEPDYIRYLLLNCKFQFQERYSCINYNETPSNLQTQLQNVLKRHKTNISLFNIDNVIRLLSSVYPDTDKYDKHNFDPLLQLNVKNLPNIFDYGFIYWNPVLNVKITYESQLMCFLRNLLYNKNNIALECELNNTKINRRKVIILNVLTERKLFHQGNVSCICSLNALEYMFPNWQNEINYYKKQIKCTMFEQNEQDEQTNEQNNEQKNNKSTYELYYNNISTYNKFQ
jgi:hypothetical protein